MALFSGVDEDVGLGQLTDEERLKLQQAQLRSPGIVLPQLAATAISNIVPDPNLPAPLNSLPGTGLGLSAGGFVGTLGGLITSAAKSIYEKGRPTPDMLMHVAENTPEWARQANEIVGRHTDQWLSRLPHIEPVTPSEQVQAAMGAAAGGMVSPMPGGALTSLVSKLPTKLVRGAVSGLLPTFEHMPTNMPIAGALGAGIQTGREALVPKTLQEMDEEEQRTGARGRIGSLQSPDSTGPPDQQAATPSFSLINSADAAQPSKTVAAQTTPVTAQSPFMPSASGSPFMPSGAHGMSDIPDLYNTQGEDTSVVRDWLVGLGILGGSVAAARYLHGVGGKISALERSKRIKDPLFEQKVDEFESQPTQNGSITNPIGTKPVDVPIPTTIERNPIRHAGVVIGNAMLDDSTRFNDHIAAISDTDAAYRKILESHSAVTSYGPVQGKLTEFMRTGIDEQSKFAIPSPNDLNYDLARIPKDKLKIYMDAMEANNELDNRKLMTDDFVAKAKKGEPMPKEEDIEFGLWGIPNSELRIRADMGMSDPVVGPLMERTYGMVRGMPSILESNRLITEPMMKRFITEHPHFVPQMGLEGKLLYAFERRNLGIRGGAERPNAPTWHAYDSWLSNIVPLMEKQRDNRAIRDALDAYHNRHPDQPNPLERIEVPVDGTSPPSATNPIVEVIDGVSNWYKVRHPIFYEAMSPGAGRGRAVINMGNIMRKYTQSTSTGLGAVWTGKIFPMINVGYTEAVKGFNAPKDMYTSILDKGLQKASGGKAFYRGMGNVPINLGHDALTWAQNEAAIVADHMGRAFRPESQNLTNKFLRTYTPSNVMDGLLNKLSDASRQYYLKTGLHRQRVRGEANIGSPFLRPEEAMQMRSESGAMVTRTAGMDLTPELFGLNANIPGKVIYMRLRNALEEQFRMASDLGHSSFSRLNEGKPGISDTRLAYETRRLTGDPTRSGGSAAARALGSYVPYFNTSIQGMSRFAGSMTRPANMVRAALGMTGLSLIPLMTALHHKDRKTALAYLNNMQANNIGSDVPLFINDDANKPTIFKLPQEMRPLFAIANMLTSAAFMTQGMSDNEGHMDNVAHWLRNYMQHHIENNNAKAVEYSLNDAFNMLSNPAALEIPLNALGMSTSLNMAQVYNDWKDGTLGLKTLVHTRGTKPMGPNQPDGGDNIFDTEGVRRFDAALSHVSGMLASAMEAAREGNRIYQHGGSIYDALTGAWDPIRQEFKDKNPELNNIVWFNEPKSPTMTPLAEGVERTLRIMDKTQAARGAINAPDMSSSGKLGFKLENPAQDGKVPTDHTMLMMYQYVDHWNQFIKAKYMQEINQLRLREQDIMHGDETQTVKRHRINEIQHVIQGKYGEVNGLFDVINNGLSRMAGRQVSVRQNIDWNGDVTQFDPKQ